MNQQETSLRMERLARCIAPDAPEGAAALISDNAAKFYLTGTVFDGWVLLFPNGSYHLFVRRPHGEQSPTSTNVRKLENIELPGSVAALGLDYSTLTVAAYRRILAWVGDREIYDISSAVRTARSVKTPTEIEMIAASGVKQTAVYKQVPSLYRPAMTDIDLQIEIERALRRAGCIGQFRIAGDSMELFMANILAGDNADTPSPYDFAMGGGGIDPSLPVGANGTLLTPGMTVMVDANGNFNGYMTDMTRTFTVGPVDDIAPLAREAHSCSISICKELANAMRPGEKASDLYEMARRMADDAGLADYFMGHRQKAGFVGHGIGIEVNEAPVLAPRSRDIIEEGNVIALEPKFVIPGVGAVGIENSYVVNSSGPAECLTHAPEQLLPLNI